MSERLFSSSSSEMPTFPAISASVGARISTRSSSTIARSISRARARTERGTQSSERSSSMIAPLIRAIAYVSNLISRSGSKRSIAPIRPRRPYETRSCSSTCDGQVRAEAAGDELHERRVRQDQAVAQRAITRRAVLLPERLCLSPGSRAVMRRTGPRDEDRPSWPRRQNTPSIGRFILAGGAVRAVSVARLAGRDRPSRAPVRPPRARRPTRGRPRGPTRPPRARARPRSPRRAARARPVARPHATRWPQSGPLGRTGYTPSRSPGAWRNW